MYNYIMDFTIVAILVIGITAVMGIITNGIGTNFFGGKKKSEFVNQSNKMQTGWKNVGGRK
jgi:hypothetical protein